MKEQQISARKLTVTAVLMAMNIIMSTSALSIPVPGGHMYLNDVIIVTAAVLLEPFYAFLVGGVGAFIGDMLFYPAPMFVSLAVHGLQAVVISLFVHRWMKDRPRAASITGAVIGWIITFTGYSLQALMGGKSPKEALTTASAASALAVQVQGAANAIPKPAQVKEFLNRANKG